MRVLKHAAAAAVAAALAGPVALTEAKAQPAPAGQVAKAHLFARAILQRMGGEKMLDVVLLSRRGVMVAALAERGKTRAQAEEITDGFVMPDMRARAPELMAKFEDVLVANFSQAELQAVLNGNDSDAQRTAWVKAEHLPVRFSIIGQVWGNEVGMDAIENNLAALGRLGLNKPEIIR